MSSKQLSKLFPQAKKGSTGVAKGRVGKKQAALVPDKKQAKKVDADHSDPSHDGVEHLLRQFDLSSKYGPCIGMTRLERWERAEKLGLSPPQDVLAALKNYLGASKTPDCKENQCLWEGRV